MDPIKLQMLREESAAMARLERSGIVRSTRSSPAASNCFFKGPDAGPRGWHYCEHPADPLGADLVCACKGCGPRCPGYSENRAMRNVWMYGVTTIPKRRNTYLPRTLESLRKAGFTQPRLFVDGDEDIASWKKEFNLEVTCRWPIVKCRANWMLSIAELYFRNRRANMFAIFQDDVIVCKDLMQYLDNCKLPADGYFNLFTMPPPHQIELPPQVGWHQSNQKGRGALALVFTRNALMTLLTARHMVDNFQDAHLGDLNVDGGISDSFRKANWREYVHQPSLVMHIGEESSIGHKKHPNAVNFQGEDWSALSLFRG